MGIYDSKSLSFLYMFLKDFQHVLRKFWQFTSPPVVWILMDGNLSLMLILSGSWVKITPCY